MREYFLKLVRDVPLPFYAGVLPEHDHGFRSFGIEPAHQVAA